VDRGQCCPRIFCWHPAARQQGRNINHTIDRIPAHQLNMKKPISNLNLNKENKKYYFFFFYKNPLQKI
jgi:hypothetical protein